MAQKKRGKVVDKWKLKRWYQILGSPIFQSKVIGETPAVELEDTVGRTVALSLTALVGDMRKQQVKATLEITRLSQGKAIADLMRIELMPAAVKRVIRKHRDRIDDSFIAQTKDKVQIRIKPLLVTRTNASKEKRSLIRRYAKQLIEDYLKESNFDDFASKVMRGTFQKELQRKMNKLQPIRTCEIRVLERIEKPAMPSTVETGTKIKTKIKTEETVEKESVEEDVKSGKEPKKKETNKEANKEANRGANEETKAPEKKTIKKEKKEKASAGKELSEVKSGTNSADADIREKDSNSPSPA